MVLKGRPVQELVEEAAVREQLRHRHRDAVLADVAEHADEISVERAEEARRRAQEKLAGTLTTAEETEFQNALAMAEARLHLARMRRG